MKDKYVIVVGDNPELSLKKYSDQLKDWKESSWLYNGITLQSDYSREELISNVLADKNLLPTVILDNDQWMSRDKFGEANWENVIRQCLSFTNKDAKITVYTYH